ncbi:LL-diaminopimelate aminotransferase [Candidatus Saganbacteria bacterium]|nr:LL-diaminopimelate aminotransferase [Candidatus Saganbacteria bacterium]
MKKAKRIAKVPPYLFVQIDKQREAMKARGVDIINLGIGDPDLPTPDHITQALHQAIDNPRSFGYPPYEGTFAFREAVAFWYHKRFLIDLDPNSEVMALIGSKEGIAHLFFALLDPGDIALIPDPAYPVYKTATLLAGGRPHLLPLLEKNGFLPDLKKIPASIARKAKLMFINYPNNPTGATADADFLEEAVAFCRKYDILLCSDLAYSEIAFEGYKPLSVLEIPGAKEVAVEFHSLSKTYNCTGFRLGMAVGNSAAINALSIIKTNVDSGAYMALQMAGVEALTGSQSHLKETNGIYERRRNIVVEGLKKAGFQLQVPKAGFYIWPKVPKGYTSAKFVSELLEKTGVLVVPGSGYGKYGEGYFRISITSPDERLREAVKRVAAL